MAIISNKGFTCSRAFPSSFAALSKGYSSCDSLLMEAPYVLKDTSHITSAHLVALNVFYVVLSTSSFWALAKAGKVQLVPFQAWLGSIYSW